MKQITKVIVDNAVAIELYAYVIKRLYPQLTTDELRSIILSNHTTIKEE